MLKKIFALFSIILLCASIYYVHFYDKTGFNNMNDYEKGIFYYNQLDYFNSKKFLELSINEGLYLEKAKFYLIWMNYNKLIKLDEKLYRNYIDDLYYSREIKFILADEAFSKGFYEKSAELYRELAEPMIFDMRFPKL
jgi:tetratricopeptide (TPR) repeat protein